MNLVNLNIKHAIKHRLLLEFQYGIKGVQKVEPYCYGVTPEGKLSLKAFLLKTKNWEIFDLDNTTNIKVLTQDFNPEERTNYKMSERGMKIVYAEI